MQVVNDGTILSHGKSSASKGIKFNKSMCKDDDPSTSNKRKRGARAHRKRTQRELNAMAKVSDDGSSGVDEAVMLNGLEIGFRRDKNMSLQRNDSLRFRKPRKEESSKQENGNSNAGRGYFKEDDVDFSMELDGVVKQNLNQKVSSFYDQRVNVLILK